MRFAMGLALLVFGAWATLQAVAAMRRPVTASDDLPPLAAATLWGVMGVIGYIAGMAVLAG